MPANGTILRCRRTGETGRVIAVLGPAMARNGMAGWRVECIEHTTPGCVGRRYVVSAERIRRDYAPVMDRKGGAA